MAVLTARVSRMAPVRESFHKAWAQSFKPT